ncbi:hypothetical protein [Priestia aryabhattai]|uniref:hypothetical protein n=1 Tax=Priestia aryabhattai TaxID=412384 RepID=UPI001C8E2A2D|nr:hypothetical protein [Priestia aryabhattai]MBX9997321.1 hypothetical protein [Priestia aryabhattai]
MKSQLNRFGEIEIAKNNIVYSMPVNRFSSEDRDTIEELYKNKLSELEYNEHFAFANSITELRAHFMFTYELKDCVNFMSIRKLRFEEVVPLLKALVQIAKVSEETNTKVLWNTNNFFINMSEKTIQAILFEFEGMEIYSNKKPLDGLKELIILSVTTLSNVIVKKPSKIDFIEKREEIYQFIEDVLKATSVDQIEAVIENALALIEVAAEREYEEKLQKKQKTFIGRFSKNKKVENVQSVSLSDKIKKELFEESQKSGSKGYKEKKSFMDKVTSPTGIAVLVPIVLVVMVGYFITDGFTDFGSKDKTAYAKEKNELKVKDIYIDYLNGDKEKAYSELDSMGYDNLAGDDQDMLIKWYIEQKKYVKAISLNKDSAYLIGDNFAKDKDKAGLEQLTNQVDSKVLKFDLAALNKDYEGIIANQDLDKFNKRRAYELVKAYSLTNNEDDLEKFVNKFEKKDDGSEAAQKQIEILQDAQSTVSTYADNLKDIDKQIEDKKKEVKEQEAKVKDKNNKDENKEEELKNKQEELKNLEQQREDTTKMVEEF